MDIKGDWSHLWRSAVSHESCKKYPNFCEKFPPCGSHSARKYNSGKRGCPSHGGEKIFASLFEEIFAFVHIPHRPKSDQGRRNVFRSFGSVDIRERWIRRRLPNRFLCHTDDCKEIIPVSEASRAIWSFVHSVSFTSANVVFTARRRLSRGSQGPVYFAKRVSPRDHRENPRENIRVNRADIVSFSFSFDGNPSQAIVLFSSVDSAERRVLSAVFDA